MQQGAPRWPIGAIVMNIKAFHGGGSAVDQGDPISELDSIDTHGKLGVGDRDVL